MSKTRKARKQYRCHLCGELIPEGTVYYYRRVTPWDHPDNERFFSFRTHEDCIDCLNDVHNGEFELPMDDTEFRHDLEVWRAQKNDQPT